MTNNRGVALIVILMASMALTVILSSLVQLARNQAFDALDRHKRATLRCLLESGVARAQSDLSDNNDARQDVKESVPGLDGTFEVHYSPVNTTSPDGSVNNLTGQTAVDGPRGPGTVPPATADVVVTANSGGVAARAEVLISYGGDEMPYGVAGSNLIRLIGDTDIRTSTLAKAKSGVGPSKVKAGLHSNYPGLGTAISWQKLDANDRAQVDGVVSTLSAADKAVDFGEFNKRLTIQTGAGKRSFPSLNIIDIVSNATGDTNLELKPGAGLTLEGKDFVATDDLNVSGDLELDDAKLYVQGDLHVTGAIKGTGTVYVNGETVFRGDSDLETNDYSKGLSICSEGSVSLEGFDPDGFMAEGGPELEAQWKLVQDELDQVRAIAARWKSFRGKEFFEQLPPAVQLDLAGEPESEQTKANLERDLLTLKQVADRLTLDETGHLDVVKATLEKLDYTKFRARVIKRVNTLHDWFEPTSTYSDSALDNLDEEAGMTRGVFHKLVAEQRDYKTAQRLGILSQFIDQKMRTKGRSAFTGIIYTHGSIYCANTIDITGSLWADGDSTKAPTTTSDGEKLAPGDIVLKKGVDVSYSSKLVEGFVKNLPGGDRPTGVKAWLQI